MIERLEITLDTELPGVSARYLQGISILTVTTLRNKKAGLGFGRLEKGERGYLVLLVHQAPGNNIVQALFLAGECDNDETDKEGEYGKHFSEKAESSP